MPPEIEREEPTGNIDGIDADALLAEVENGSSRNIPMEAPKADPVAAAATPAPTISDFEFEYNGKQIKVPYQDPKVKTWAAQGYDYSQKMAQFNQQKAEFEKSFSPYKLIDDFAKQNPDWWEHVEKSYQARKQSGATPNASANPDLQALTAQIKAELENELKPIKDNFEQTKLKEQQAKIQSEDQALENEIKSIREQYKDLDWDTKDQTGQSLEMKVVKHAIDNDIKNFRAAFRDYNHENLIKRAQESGKSLQTKELQKRTKLGIIGESSTPKKGINPAEGVKNKSYNDLLRESLEEAGIA